MVIQLYLDGLISPLNVDELLFNAGSTFPLLIWGTHFSSHCSILFLLKGTCWCFPAGWDHTKGLSHWRFFLWEGIDSMSFLPMSCWCCKGSLSVPFPACILLLWSLEDWCLSWSFLPWRHILFSGFRGFHCLLLLDRLFLPLSFLLLLFFWLLPFSLLLHLFLLLH